MLDTVDLAINCIPAINSVYLLPPANEVWGKVICLQVCVCPQGGACSRGVVLSRGLPGLGRPGPGGCLVETPQTATAAGGTHPTGMHSCYYFYPGIFHRM